MRISYRCYCLSSRFACLLLLFIARSSKGADSRGERSERGTASPKCATLNCKILNHNFIFYYASSLLKADDDDDEANEILWLAIASNLFGRTKHEVVEQTALGLGLNWLWRSQLASLCFTTSAQMIFEFELCRLFGSAICQMIFFIFIPRRLSRTGSSYRWCWTASSFGCSRYPVSLVPAPSSVNRPRSTTPAPQSIVSWARFRCAKTISCCRRTSYGRWLINRKSFQVRCEERTKLESRVLFGTLDTKSR